MVTPAFIALWFTNSAIIFFIFVAWVSHKIEVSEIPRDLNALLILLSQGIGAAISYALLK